MVVTLRFNRNQTDLKKNNNKQTYEMTFQVIQITSLQNQSLAVKQASGFSTVKLLKTHWVEQPQFAQLDVTF